MRLPRGKCDVWTKYLNCFILSVLFKCVIKVESLEYKTFDIIPDGTGRIARVIEGDELQSPQDEQFASRRGSLDIRSKYWTTTRKDPEYPEEPEGEIVGLTDEEAERRPYVQVDRTGKEHTVTISMPRMERRGRNHLIKKFVLQPVIQYVVQYDKNAQNEAGEETQASTNFEEYEGYEGQEKMVKGHGKSIDRFFNDIDAKFETYWGNDGVGGYPEGGDSMTGDGGGYQEQGQQGGFENSGAGGENSQGQGGYPNDGGNFGGGQNMGGGGYDNTGRSHQGGGQTGGYDNQGNFGGSQSQGNFDEGNGAQSGYTNAGGSQGSQGGGFSNNGGNAQNGNTIAHDFGFAMPSAGGYSSANQFHQPPDVNAFVSTGGYGAPAQTNSMASSTATANTGMGGGSGGSMVSGYSAPMNGMNLGNNALQVNNNVQQGNNNGFNQMFNPSGISGVGGASAAVNSGVGGFSVGASGTLGGVKVNHHGGSSSLSFGVQGGGMGSQMSQNAPQQSGFGSNMGLSSPTASLNSLYGVPGVTPGKPLGIEMMMNAMNAGTSSAAVAGSTSSSSNPMLGLMMSGQMSPASAGAMMGGGGSSQAQNVAMMQSGLMSPAMGQMGVVSGTGAVSSGASTSSSCAMPPGMCGSMGMTSATPAQMGMTSATPAQMGMTSGTMGAMIMNALGAINAMGGMNTGGGMSSVGTMSGGSAASLVASGGSSGISMAFGAPGPIGMGISSGGGTTAGGMAMGGQAGSSYGPPGSTSAGSLSDSYGPPKQEKKKPPSSSYGPPKDSQEGGYSSPKEPAGGYSPPKEPAGGYGPPKEPAGGYGPPKEPAGGYGSNDMMDDDMGMGDDSSPPRGKGKKPGGGGGKSKGRGLKAAKSLLSSLPLPKIPQSIGGHLSFMFSTGVGKSRRNRGGGMMSGGGGGKSGGEKLKQINKEQVSDHILNILGLSGHHPPCNNATLANTTNPILLWEQNGNRTSLNHTSNLQEATLEDVVDLLPVDNTGDILSPAPTDVPQESGESDVTSAESLSYEIATTTTTQTYETTTNLPPSSTSPTKKKESTNSRKPKSQNILIATIPPPSPIPPMSSSVLIATVKPVTFSSSFFSASPPANITTAIVPPSTVKPLELPLALSTPVSMTSTQAPTTSSSSKPILIATTTEAAKLSQSPVVSMTSTPSTVNPLFTTSPPTTFPSLPDFTPRIRTRPRQGKTLIASSILVATPPSRSEIVLTPVPPPQPNPTPSISIEFDPIQDYINHNLGNNVLTVGKSPGIVSHSPIHHHTHNPPPSLPRPNIQAYYAEHNLHPVKIEHFDPWIYDALQAAFQSPANNELLDNWRRRRSRVLGPFRPSFPFPYPLPVRPRSLFSRFSNLLSKRVDNFSPNGTSTLAVIASKSLSIPQKVISGKS